MTPKTHAGPTVVFRVDSGTHLGSGHVMRCVALALELRRRGAHVLFVSRAHAGHISNRVEADGFEVALLPAPAECAAVTHEEAATMLGASQARDAQETLCVLGKRPVDWVVADHYGVGVEWETTVRSCGAKLFVIDDVANRAHNADALLDQNFFGTDTQGRYRSLVPEGCLTLLGPRFALLHPEYAVLRRVLPARGRIRRRVLVAFGGSDSTNETAIALAALSRPQFSDLAVDIVLGPNHPAPEEILQAAARRPGTAVHRNLSSLAGLIARADLSVGAAGSTTWERLCLGLPSAVVTVADNQIVSTRALAAAGYLRWIGSAPTATSDYVESLSQLDFGVDELPPLVDGLGAKRVAEVVCPSAAVSGRVRRAGSADTGVFFSGDVFAPPDRARAAWKAHEAWFAVERRNPAADLGVLYNDDWPIGWVRVTDGTATDAADRMLECSVDPTLQGSGWESWVTAEATRVSSLAGLPAPLTSTLGARSATRRRFVRLAAGAAASVPLSLVFLTARNSWINHHLATPLTRLLRQGHRIVWSHDASEVPSGQLCFALGWERLLDREFRSRFAHVLVVHASDVPHGRGMSPLTWQILGGRHQIVVSLLEAEDLVDSGDVYAQERLAFAGTELLPEMHYALGAVTAQLCEQGVTMFAAGALRGRTQVGEPSWYPRRRPADSRLDVTKSVAEQFDLLRVVDNHKYPAFFEARGRRYELHIHAVPGGPHEDR